MVRIFYAVNGKVTTRNYTGLDSRCDLDKARKGLQREVEDAGDVFGFISWEVVGKDK